jgi:hypothetical protein
MLVYHGAFTCRPCIPLLKQIPFLKSVCSSVSPLMSIYLTGFNYIWGRRAYAALSSPSSEGPSQPQSSQPSQSSQSSQSSQPSQGQEGGRVPLPGDLVTLSRRVASAVGFVSPLNAEAGICNFYPLDGSMGGREDIYLYVCMYLYICVSIYLCIYLSIYI